MAKIVYLFGAGASANALPIVNQIPNRIKRMIAELPQLEEKEKFVYKSINNIVKELQDELLWLYEAIGNHASIDTLAKKLWVKGGGFNDDYYRLKFATAAYFTLEQVYNKPDQRYDTFWASMLDIRILERLPANITILSWNYDSQFEFAFKEYQIYNEITSIQSCLGMDERGDTGDCFNILKLNGSALLLEQSASDEKYRIIDPFFSAPY